MALRGLGMPHLRGQGRGELYVHFKVQVPQKLTDDEKSLLRQFAEATGENLDEVAQVGDGDDEGGLGGFFRRRKK